ncbi:MAG: radical SAM protein [Candidatus Thorarchaeota archaeon]|jgi:cyclic pyranopterin phosphate synthase
MNGKITRMRVSVTTRCNFQCQFCHGEGLTNTLKSSELTVNEYETLARAASLSGITEVKILGGEALMRCDLEEVIAAFASYIPEVSMTTNGYGLNKRAKALRKSGLSRINISIHSLDETRYAEITGRDYLNDVLDDLSHINCWGFEKVQINTTLLRGINDNEITDFLHMAFRLDVDEIQLIELQPCERMDPLQNALLIRNPREVLTELRGFHIRPVSADTYKAHLNGDIVTVSVLRLCNDRHSCPSFGSIQVTPEGSIKHCFWDNSDLSDIRAYLKEGDVKSIRSSIKKASGLLKNKCTLYCQDLDGTILYREPVITFETGGGEYGHV